MLASRSPEFIVGRHVLLRLCVPRYPPLALCSLTYIIWLFNDIVFWFSPGLELTIECLFWLFFLILYAVFKVLF
jgi:hypothetical protein